MTAETRQSEKPAAAPGVPYIEDGELVSTHPASGDVIGRFPVADGDAVRDAVARAREAARWWAGLGFDGRTERLRRWCSIVARRLPELAALVHREGGKPVGDAILEITGAVDHIAWSARHAKKVLGLRRVRGGLFMPDHSALLEYQPYGVVGVVGPWNYPVFTPLGSIAYALAAGNAVVFKPSEYTPAVGQWLADTFAEVVEEPVFQTVHGLGDTGAALCSAGVDKVAFTGSTRTGKKVMAACAGTLTPVLVECGGKDAMIVDADADLDAAADAACWGGMSNAGQTCVGIERVYVVSSVADDFVDKLVARASALTVGDGDGADVGPITMPSQLDVIRRHIDDAVAAGGRAVLGGPSAVEPPYVHPTVLLDVPEDSAAVREETFGPTLVVNRVATADEAVERANAVGYGLGSSVFSRRRAVELARRLRAGMTSVNSAIGFAAIPTLPFGGVGDSGFGRIHGADGLREFARPKAIAKRRMRSPLPFLSFDRTRRTEDLIVKAVRLVHGRRG
jgi:succinate-semialdehyde dehydrogenase/glutarate-semialdehyde dehydrogenase